MHKTLTILLLFLTFNSFGQTSTLNINTHITDTDIKGIEDFRIIVTTDEDTVHNELLEFDADIAIDSLYPGLHKIYIYNTKIQREPYIIKYINISRAIETTVNIVLDISEEKLHLDPGNKDIELIKEKTEGQFTVSYYDTDWMEDESLIRANFNANMSMSTWFISRKRSGLLLGGGFGVSQHYFTKDSTFINTPQQYKLIHEKYNYVYTNIELKFRLTSNNMQNPWNKTTKLLLDIGATYNVPLLFREVGVYKNDRKIVNKNLHEFTDLRVFVNFGYAPILFFFEYRLADFVLGKYLELPVYNAGIRIVFDAD